MRALRATRQILQADRSDFFQLLGMAPDIDEPLLPHVATGQGKLHAKDKTRRREKRNRRCDPRCNAGSPCCRHPAGAAAHRTHRHCRRKLRREKAGAAQTRLHSNRGSPRSPSIIGVTVGSEYTWRQVHPPAPGRRDSPAVFRHQHIGNDDLQALRLEKADRVDRSPQRAWNFGDRVMHLGPVRVNVDLNRFHSQITQARCLRFADQHRIGLQLDAEDRRR